MIVLLAAAVLTLAHNSQGTTLQHRKDTLADGSRKVVGVAVPTDAFVVPGDLNYDGRRSTADIILLVRNVFNAMPLPSQAGPTIDTVVIPVMYKDSIPYLFIPTGGVNR
jgi:hypothetical protein